MSAREEYGGEDIPMIEWDMEDPQLSRCRVVVPMVIVDVRVVGAVHSIMVMPLFLSAKSDVSPSFFFEQTTTFYSFSNILQTVV